MLIKKKNLEGDALPFLILKNDHFPKIETVLGMYYDYIWNTLKFVLLFLCGIPILYGFLDFFLLTLIIFFSEICMILI